MHKIKLVYCCCLLISILYSFYSCSLSGTRLSNRESIYSKNASWSDPTPYGMIKIPRGHITMGLGANDSLWGDLPQIRSISVESFWIDQHEVTNAQYQEFIRYVRDSILRERLSDPKYGGDDRYKISEDKDGEPVIPHLDWSIPLPKEEKANEEELEAINSLYYTNYVTGERYLDPKQLLYRYEIYDHQQANLYASELRDLLSNTANNRLTELPLIEKDTAYMDLDGNIKRERIQRRLSSPYDFINTYIVAIHPDEEVWTKDWPNSQNDIYSRNYFRHKGYEHYPVVGISWEQANAYCAWRTEQARKTLKLTSDKYFEPFRLPTEAEFEYAARAGNDKLIYPWSSPTMLDSDDCLCGNFKPANGNYTADKHLITAPVKSYAPNEYGVYDMGGNVAEWTSTTYSISNFLIVDDINPEVKNLGRLGTNKPKVVKGGSWKDIAKYIRAGSKAMEFPTKGRSYIGFRCVRSTIDFTK